MAVGAVLSGAAPELLYWGGHRLIVVAKCSYGVTALNGDPSTGGPSTHGKSIFLN
jgi:hypothetical protein